MLDALSSARQMSWLRSFCALVCMSWALALAGLTAGAARASTAEAAPAPATRISLVTMGPGDHLYTRGGHAALMVEWTEAGTKKELLYNFGDADWDNQALAWNFLMGDLIFRLDAPGDLMTVATDYGVRQNRDVFTQTLALSPSQAEAVRARLEELDTDEKRDYAHDYVRSICTTKVRDIVDDVIGGAINKQLSSLSDGMTIREHQRRAFNGKPLAGLGADLLLGQENDLVLSRYDALFVPDRMRMYLQEVEVDSPSGPVPLAAPPVQVAGRQVDIQGDGPTWGSWYFVLPLMGWLAWRARSLRARFALAGLGAFAVWPALLFGLIGCALWGMQMLSHETGFQNNPLALAFLPLDLLLVPVCIRFKRGQRSWLTLVRGYAVIRALMAVAVLFINITADGAAPLALPLLALNFFGLLAWLSRPPQ